MATIVELGSRIQRNDPEVWQCNCGCHTFRLYADGSAVCSACGGEALEMLGFWRPDRPKPANQESGHILPFNSDISESVFPFSPRQKALSLLLPVCDPSEISGT
jgi:hypothetical protein